MQAVVLRLAWKSFTQWWWMILPIGILLAAIVNSYLIYQHVPVYRAFTRVQIKSSPEAILSPEGQSGERFVENQLALLRSDLVLEPVLAEPAIARIPELANDNAVSYLASRIHVLQLGRSEFYELSFTNPNPQHAKLVIDAITKSFIALHSGREHERSQVLVGLLQEERSIRETQLAELEEHLRTLTRKSGGEEGAAAFEPPLPGVLPSRGSPALPPRLASLQSQRADTEFDLLMVRAKLQTMELLESQTPIEPSPGAIQEALAQHPEVVAAEQRLSDLQAKLIAGREAAAEKNIQKNPFLKKYTVEIAKTESYLDELRKTLEPEIAEEFAALETRRRLQAREALREEEKQLELTANVLKERAASEMAGLKVLQSETLLNIEFTRMEMAFVRETVATINGRLMQIEVERRAPERIEAINEGVARVPTAPVDVLPWKKLGLATLVSLLLPFSCALAWEFRIRRISGSQEIVENNVQLPIVAEISHLPTLQRASAHSSRGQHDLWLYEESVNSLGTSLLLTESAQRLQVIAITSAASREGKTSVASQLALSLARASGQQTLLIDGDMRSPDIHNNFDLESAPGLAEVLAGELPVSQAIEHTFDDNLDVLAAGTLLGSPHALLGRGDFARLLEDCRKRYRYIVVDTPPLLAASEALIMARDADASLVCALRSVSRIHQVRMAFERLQTTGANPLGVILNGVPTRSYAYAYGKYAYGKYAPKHA